MAIKTINRCCMKEDGNTNEICCPVCKNQVEISIIKNTNFDIVSVLLDKERTENYAVCPSCATVFSVNENYISERKNGTTCFLTADDLTIIKKV